ncbi:MAG: TRAM domain-containing protein [Candidatus Marsarchaeota archaeon]|nr:TRAM domain-containing protein [Candidatus Marsarchaeota archaeon]
MPRDMDMGGDRGDRGERRSRGLNPNYFLPKPVKVGDEVEVTIDATASKGDGLAKKDGFVIFVKDAKQGETVKVRITDVRARFAVGEIVGSATSVASAAQTEEEPQEPAQ